MALSDLLTPLLLYLFIYFCFHSYKINIQSAVSVSALLQKKRWTSYPRRKHVHAAFYKLSVRSSYFSSPTEFKGRNDKGISLSIHCSRRSSMYVVLVSQFILLLYNHRKPCDHLKHEATLGLVKNDIACFSEFPFAQHWSKRT